MKINLMDPGLKGAGGHHYDWDRRIANLLAASGHEVRVYAFARADIDKLDGFARDVQVEKLFRMDPYVRPLQFDPISGTIERMLVGRQLIGEDLQKVAEADLWLWPTLFCHQLLGCAAAKPVAAISGCIDMPPAGDLPLPHAEPGPWWRFAANSLRQRGHVIRALGSGEAEEVSAFLPFIGDLDPCRLPVPVDGTPRERRELKTVGFFGSKPRDEHGSHVVGALIELCLRDGLDVVTQAGDLVPAAMRSHPQLKHLDNAGEFPGKLESCDLVVAPYRWEMYVARGSGTLWQAMASGVPCVAPAGASISRTMARAGSVSLFSELSPRAVFAAIQHAKQNYAALAAAALRSALEWPEQNGLARYVDVMTNGRRSM
ncbi:MAG: hypothetical protein P4L72_09045 [Parvibaculum sp.]|uniref:glycosyltransferase n=1 Tax=Parvibaculum sp. TaxID=2024848 RepID=UPI00284F4D3F|nr:hypothetical protein [Parvibaculum sp.]MDR3499359.1 hypothetical protein [Parvibaculum sp.]